jgi:hypothetical protein
MNCVEWEERVAMHAGGDVAGAGALEVERHLAECSACQMLWSGIRESLAVLREAHAELPTAAHFTAVRSRVIAELERGARPWHRLAWISGAAALAVLALVLARVPARVSPAPPRMAAWIPSAPEVAKIAAVVRPHLRKAAAQTPLRAPLTIKLQTSDPNIVIYWIAD